VISHDVISEESTLYYNTSDTVGPESRCYSAPEIKTREEQPAWGNKFDQKEAPCEKAPERIVRQEEQEEVFYCGDAKEILAPFHQHKPQFGSLSRGQSSIRGDGDSDNDNSAGREEMPFVQTRKNKRKSDSSGMLTGLRPDTNSPYWKSQRVKLNTTEGMGSTHSKWPDSGTSNTGTSEAIVEAVYMMEPGPNLYKSAMESDAAWELQEAIYSECVSLEKNKVFIFVHLIPERKKAIPTKLILQSNSIRLGKL